MNGDKIVRRIKKYANLIKDNTGKTPKFLVIPTYQYRELKATLMEIPYLTPDQHTNEDGRLILFGIRILKAEEVYFLRDGVVR